MPETTVVTTVTQEVPPGEPPIPPVNGVLISPPPLPTPPPLPGIIDHRPPGRLFFMLGICKHLLWAGMLGMWGNDIQATAITELLKIFNGPVNLAAMLIFSSTAALVGVFNKSTLIKVLCYFPQQYLMVMAMVSIIIAVCTGQDAGGDVKPWQDIFTNQVSAILVAVFHTIAMIRLCKRV